MKLIAYVDGGCKNQQIPEKRKAYGSFVIFDSSVNSVFPSVQGTENFENATNNEAEYKSLLTVLNALHYYSLQKYNGKKIKEIKIFCDSRLVVEQINGKFKCKANNLKLLLQQARNKLIKLSALQSNPNIKLEWTSRETIMEKLGH